VVVAARGGRRSLSRFRQSGYRAPGVVGEPAQMPRYCR
jgi:hypothetical protein